jgi:hypothetical protein
MTDAPHDPSLQDEAPPRLAGQNRLRLIGICFTAFFLAIAGQVTHLTLFPKQDEGPLRPITEGPLPRPDIIDRNGVLLATDVAVASIFADPSKIIDIDEAVELLTATMPDVNAKELRRKLTTAKRFAWIKRQVSPEERDAVYNLGIPGVSYVNERRRVYPQGRLSSHVVGYVDLDTKGIAGIEKYLDDQGALYTASLADPETQSAYPAQISVDIRVQHVLADELGQAIAKFKALAGGAVVLAGGAATNNNQNGGAMTIRGGAKHGSGADGVLSLGVTNTSAINIGKAAVLTRNVGYFQAGGNAAVTATVGGGTTGLIPAGASFVTVTCDHADKSISLPAGVVGDVIRILMPGTGCELISAVAADKVNEVVVGATNELALIADALYTFVYTKSGYWIATGETKAGARINPLVPDALA